VPGLDTGTSFLGQTYAALKRVITAIDIYDQAHEIRLDERRPSEVLGGQPSSRAFGPINLQSPWGAASVVEDKFLGRRIEPCP